LLDKKCYVILEHCYEGMSH